MLYDAPNCEATAPQLAEMLGYSDFPPVNALMGKLGKRIANHLGIELHQRKNNSPGWWQILAEGEKRPGGFTWCLRNDLFDALVELGLLHDFDAKLYPEVVSPALNLSEGKKRQIQVNAFERNGVARVLCIEHFGAQCTVCGFDFGKQYGEIGEGFMGLKVFGKRKKL